MQFKACIGKPEISWYHDFGFEWVDCPDSPAEQVALGPPGGGVVEQEEHKPINVSIARGAASNAIGSVTGNATNNADDDDVGESDGGNSSNLEKIVRCACSPGRNKRTCAKTYYSLKQCDPVCPQDCKAKGMQFKACIGKPEISWYHDFGFEWVDCPDSPAEQVALGPPGGGVVEQEEHKPINVSIARGAASNAIGSVTGNATNNADDDDVGESDGGNSSNLEKIVRCACSPGRNRRTCAKTYYSLKQCDPVCPQDCKARGMQFKACIGKPEISWYHDFGFEWVDCPGSPLH